ncbi:MAG: hypothetical protein QXO75_12100, partial [Nitrososphaerota archaeon]
PLFYVDREGRVGIGTENPPEKLSVLGNIFASGNLEIQGNQTIGGDFGVQGNLNVFGLTTLSTTTISRLTISELTPGSVLFAGPSGQISENNQKLFWDNTNFRLGIGTNTPQGILHVATGTVNALVVDDSGNVGIGTTAPLAKLHVHEGSISLDANYEILFGDNGQIRSRDNNHRILFRRTENKLELREYGDLIFSPGATAGTETAKVVMLANGNVGIGTTAPGAPLEIRGTQDSKLRLTDTENSWNRIEFWNSTQRTWFLGPLAAGQFGLYHDASFLYNVFIDASDNININAGRLYLHQSSGNVGIGTTNPNYKLHVYDPSNDIGIVAHSDNASKAAYVSSYNSSADSGNYIQMRSYGNTTGGTLFGLSTNKLNTIWSNYDSAFAIGTLRATPLVFGTNNTEQMRIQSNGNVGIGTTGPVNKLDIRGGIYVLSESETIGGDTLNTVLRIPGTSGFPYSRVTVYKSSTGGGNVIYLGNNLYGTINGTLVREDTNKEGALVTIGRDRSTITFSVSSVDTAGNVYQDFLIKTGNVGIGTTNPSHRLSVVGSQTEPTYGDNLIVNGDFSNGSQGWTVGEGWTITDQASHSTGYTQPLSQDISVTNGTTYQIEWTQTGATAGTLTFSIGSVSSRTISYWELTKTTITASGSGTQTFSITPSSDYNGSIDNITVRAITSYSQPVFSLLNTDQTTGLEIRTGGTGNYNTFVGLGAGSRNTGGRYNTALGYQALYSNTTGFNNVGVGLFTLYSNTTGYENIAIGTWSLYSNTFGNSNIGIGYASLYSNTTGSNNVAIGYRSLYSITTGYQNVAIGVNAGRYLSDGSSPNQTSNRSVYLGTNTKASADGVTNEI